MNQIYKEEYSEYAVEVVGSVFGDSNPSSCDYMAEISWPSDGEDKATVTAEVKQQLNRRLKALEEEAEFSKQSIVRGLEERKKLTDEISVHLNFIRYALFPLNQVAGSSSWQGTLIINPVKKARYRAGLSQVLEQEVEQGQLVGRDVKVNTRALQHHHQLFT